MSLNDIARLVLLTEGHSNPNAAKTAVGMIRYRRPDVVAVLDSTQAGKTAEDLFGVGGGLPIVASLSESPPADALLIGIAPPGGRVPGLWRPVLREALTRGMAIVSGLHDFLGDDPELAPLAAKHQARIFDVRKNNHHTLADGRGFQAGCVRVLTVGQDCCVGKMVAALETQLALRARGEDAHFIATGQTGIMIAGEGCPVDCVGC